MNGLLVFYHRFWLLFGRQTFKNDNLRAQMVDFLPKLHAQLKTGTVENDALGTLSALDSCCYAKSEA